MSAMIGEGERAPQFELPGVVDGSIEPVDLQGRLAGAVVVLAFYPGDFNPACEDGTTGLDDLDLVSMQRNVTVLGISGDSVYSHRAFADEYNLTIPLLSDVRGEVAAEYGVAVEGERPTHATERAVVVVDPDGDVRYAWLADERDELPDVAAIRAAVEGIDDGPTAKARYRVGHAHYVEGRRAFTSAMEAFEDREWLLAERDFDRATEELVEAAERFGTAVWFAESRAAERDYENAQEKAQTLGQAAEWLTEAASEFVKGNGAAAETLRQDAERPLEAAHGMDEPVEPDDIGTHDGPTTGAGAESATGQLVRSAGDASDDRGEATAEGGQPADDEREGSDRIDEQELETIAAELEEQTEAIEGRRADRSGADGSGGGTEPEDRTERGDADADETADATADEDELDEGEIELDLTDPTESDEDEDTDEAVDDDADGDDSESGDDGSGNDDESREGGSGGDLGSGGHGVPDSL